MEEREKNVVSKYFKKDNQGDGQVDGQKNTKDESEFGLFIDFYIKQSEGQEYVTKGLG